MTYALRRRVLGGFVGTLVPSLAGCTPVHPPPRKRLIIYFTDSETATNGVEKRDSTWVVDLTLVNDFSSRTESGNFHDVRVVGYSREGNEVCSEQVGPVTYENASRRAGVTVRLECPAFPYEITTKARETPCDDNVEIQILRYDDERDGYRVMDRGCSDEQTGSDR